MYRKGKSPKFYGAVDVRKGETMVFSWIEWPDKATADASWHNMREDPKMKDLPEMPFDGSRMMWAVFEPLFNSATAG